MSESLHGMESVASTPPTNSLELSATFALNPIHDLHNDENASHPGLAHNPDSESYYRMLFVNIGFFTRILTLLLSVLGIVSNIFNLAVFSKLMAGDSVNVSLFGMSLSDFLVCLTSFIAAVSEFESAQKFLLLNLFINPRQIIYLLIVFPNVHFARAALTISAFVTLERCLCVAMPLKVKRIFTTIRVKVIMIFCFLFSLSTAVPYYSTYYFIRTFYPPLNRSILDYTSTVNHYDILKYTAPLVIYVFYVLLFAVIVVCTIILIVVLKKRMSWRTSVTSSAAGGASSNSGHVSAKELKVIKMMVMVASLFIACNLPCTAILLVNEMDDSISMKGSKRYIYFLLGNFVVTLQTFNSSVNVFIYYFNSTNYKQKFDQLLGRRTTEDKDSAVSLSQQKK